VVIAEGRHGGSAGNECACFDELLGRREFAMVLRLSGEARRARIRRRLGGDSIIMGHSYFVVERKHLSVSFAAPSQDPGASCVPSLSS
jgi:hypothetical protein